MRSRHVLLACGLLALVGCGASQTPPAASGSSPPASASAAASPSPAANVNATVCNELENYTPAPKTQAEWEAYLSYAQGKVDTAGLALSLSGQVQRLITDVTAYTDGVGSLSQIQTDANQLIGTCDGYGVTN